MSALLTEHRGRLVAKYRANPQVWPDGIDSKYDRWYTGHEHEWLDDGTYVGPPKMSTAAMSTAAMSTAPKMMSTAGGGKRDWAALKRKQRERLVEARRLAAQKTSGGAKETPHAANADD